MTDQEKLSWLSQCPVCGRSLIARTDRQYVCMVGHGGFRVVNGMIIFDLNEQSEGEE